MNRDLRLTRKNKINGSFSLSILFSEGSDYTLSGSRGHVIIPTGQTSGGVTLTAIVDNVKEKKEKAVMTLQPGAGYNFPANGKKKKTKAPSATVTVVD